jgi:hypothetical protein
LQQVCRKIAKKVSNPSRRERQIPNLSRPSRDNAGT